MKLRNKKTGEINWGDLRLDEFDSLAELNEQWEDYIETRKDWWYLGPTGLPTKMFEGQIMDPDRYKKELGEICNHFESEEEAERAAEKLKAWKRLKDKGIFFSLDTGEGGTPYIRIQSKKERGTFETVRAITHDLYLLFGGEE